MANKRTNWTRDNLTCEINCPDDMTLVYKAYADGLARIYGTFLDNLKNGKISKIAFDLLTDEQFYTAFKMTKNQALKFQVR